MFELGDRVKYTNPSFFRDVAATVVELDPDGDVWIEYDDGKSPRKTSRPYWCVCKEAQGFLQKIEKIEEERMSQVEVTEYIRSDGEIRPVYVEVSEEGYEIWKRLGIIVFLELLPENSVHENLIAFYARFPYEMEEEDRVHLAKDHGGDLSPMNVLDGILKSMAEE